MLSGRGVCDKLIIRPEGSYRLWRVVVCDLETSKEEAKSPLKSYEYKPTMGCDAERKKYIPNLCKSLVTATQTLNCLLITNGTRLMLFRESLCVLRESLQTHKCSAWVKRNF